MICVQAAYRHIAERSMSSTRAGSLIEAAKFHNSRTRLIGSPIRPRCVGEYIGCPPPPSVLPRLGEGESCPVEDEEAFLAGRFLLRWKLRTRA